MAKLKKENKKKKDRAFKSAFGTQQGKSQKMEGLIRSGYSDRTYLELSIEEISPDPNQPRKNFDTSSLKGLSDSIKERGVLQPVIVRTDENNKFWLVAGERRFRAAKMANLKTIPAMYNEGDAAEIALIENVQREDLSPLEEAQAYKNLKETHNYTDSELGKIVGKARSTVGNILGLNKLADEIKEKCLRVSIPQRTLILISQQKTEKEQVQMFNRYIKFNLSLEELKQPPKKNENEISKVNKLIYRANNLYITLHREEGNLDKEEIIQLAEGLDPLRKVLLKIKRDAKRYQEND